MANDPNPAMADTHARLLALEMVTTAVLNRLAGEDPKLRELIQDLASPTKLPAAGVAGGEDGLDNLQANVARLAGAIANPL